MCTGSWCSGGEEERDEGSVFQRPMRVVHAAFSSDSETLVELATMIFVRRSLYFALWLCTSGTSVNWTSLISDGATPSGRYEHTMTALADGTAVLFGGWDGGACLNDVYTLTVSGTSATWASLSSDGATPSARSRHSMSALADGTAVLFGGWDGGALLNDVYTLTVSGTSATWASLSSDGATPSGRFSHSMTALADGTVVLFGGYDGARLNDVYTLTVSGTSATWASLSSDGATPSARSQHTMTALADGTAVLFGGYNNGARLNDVYTLTVSGTSATWTSLSSDGATPSVRSEHSMTALADGTAVLFGGRESSWSDKNDVDTLTVSGTSATWASLSSDGATPSGRSSHSMTALADGTLVLFGGWDVAFLPLNEVYTLTLPTPSPTPSPMALPAASPTTSPTASPAPSSTPSPTASPTPQDEVSASGHPHLKIHFLFLELTLMVMFALGH